MPNGTDLTPLALAGFRGEAHNGLAWSPQWMAHRVGEWLRQTGRSAPRAVRMSRGYTLHVNDMRVAIRDDGAVERLT